MLEVLKVLKDLQRGAIEKQVEASERLLWRVDPSGCALWVVGCELPLITADHCGRLSERDEIETLAKVEAKVKLKLKRRIQNLV